MPRLLSTSSHRRWYTRTLSDAVPSSWLLHKLLYNGKMTAACMVLIYLGILFMIVMIIWPIHWLARLILLVLLPLQRDYSEALVCIVFVLTVQWIGRRIVYSLVFPGSSDRFCYDIASDFANYSLRVLNQVLDAGLELDSQNIQHRLSRMVQYRDRILVVYRDVFHCLYYHKGISPIPDHDDVTKTSSTGTTICSTSTVTSDEEGRGCSASNIISRTSSSYGTNTIQGDIGPLFPFFLAPNLSPPCGDRGNALQQLQHAIIQQLSHIIADLDAIEAQISSTTGTGNRNAPSYLQRQQLLVQTISTLASHCTSLKNTLNNQLCISKQETTDGDKPKSKRIALRNIADKIGLFFLGMFDPLYFIYAKPDPSRSDSASDDTTVFHASAIFNMDVLRGCFLSRYRGAKQFWIPRTTSSKSGTSDGFLDCIIIPPPSYDPSQPRKAVIYCNPNAGLYEVATGFNLMGGNVVSSKLEQDTNNWTDFYLSLGYHVVLFNYAGYGRSFGDSNTYCWSIYRKSCATRSSSPRYDNACCANQFYSWWLQTSFRRVWYSIIFGWKSTSTSHWKLSPDSLKADGFTVANFVISSYTDNGIKSLDKLVIHGESIGGMVAASTAKLLSTSCETTVPLLLVCDRTFCNLIATAQRLVGGWSGPAIRMLMPFWNTNVASDFLAAKCPKIVANDPADAIISDPSSLRSGLAVYNELLSTAKKHRYSIDDVGLIWDAPVFHRMSEWENIGIYESRFSKTMAALTVAPVWPKDRHFTTMEAFHFAACVRRIFKLATGANLNVNSKANDNSSQNESTSDEGIELSFSADINNSFDSGIVAGSNESRLLSTPLLSAIDETENPFVSSFAQDVWKILAGCDGLYGLTLGSAVQGGSADSIVSWLCSVVVFGCQTLAYSMERRVNNGSSSTVKHNIISLNSRDDWISQGVELDDYSAHLQSNPLTAPYPIAIPEVITLLRNKIDSFRIKDKGLIAIERELQYCLEVLEYIKARVSSYQVLKASWENMNFKGEGDSSSVIGSFFRLHCGHNNQFSSDEKEYFKILLRESQSYYKSPES